MKQRTFQKPSVMEPKSASFRETSLTFPTSLFACGAIFVYMNNESEARRPQPTAHRKDSQTLGPMRPRAASESLAPAPGAPGWRPNLESRRPAPPPPVTAAQDGVQAESPSRPRPGDWAERGETFPTRPLIPAKPSRGPPLHPPLDPNAAFR